jgi:hypothetical protein
VQLEPELKESKMQVAELPEQLEQHLMLQALRAPELQVQQVRPVRP